MPPYEFEHDGHKVTFSRNTVRAVLEADRIQDKLLGALGYVSGNPAPENEAAFIAEYAECMARSTTDAPWWGHSNLSNDELRARYQAYSDEDGKLVVEFRKANFAVSMPKKTDSPTTPT